jgi:hypothetical protein
LQNIQNIDFDKPKVRYLKLKTVKYCIFNQELFQRDTNGVLLRCVDEEEANRILTDFHKGVCGGHHHWKDTTFKILRACYYCPILFSDVFS